MKRTFAILLVVLIAGTLCAQAMTETSADSVLKVNVAVMSGPTGFSSVGLTRNDGRISDRVVVDINVYPSPNEVIARLANGELDVAALPTNVAANLYNKGVKVKLAAVVGNGMLGVLSANDSVQSIEDLLGRTIHVPGPGSTPDQMATLLLEKAGLEVGKDVILDYSVAAPAQLAQLVIAGRVELAMLPQPFVSMILRSNPKARTVVDVQSVYQQLTGYENYPMSVLVVSERFFKSHPTAFAEILKAYEESVAWVNANPQEAGKAIEAAGIMASAMATPAIPYCNLVFIPSREAKADVQAYYSYLYGFSPDSIGGAMPSDDLYL